MRATHPRPAEPIANIQALRALAALLVVFHHLRTMLIDVPGLHEIAEFGWRGVDLFFVISGFIMVFITRRSNPTPLGFLANRIARIVPLYWIFTLAMLAVTWAMPSGLDNSVGSPANLLRSLAFIPYMRPDGGVFPLLPLGWSLNLEMAFYIAFALALLLAPGNRRMLLLSAALILVAVAGVLVPDTSPILGFYTRPVVAEFALGMLIGLFHDRLPAPRGPALPAVAALSGIGLVIGAGHVPENGLAGWLMTMFGWALLVMAALQMERSGIAVRARPVVLIGDASYALYLSHLFFVRIAEILARRLFPNDVGLTFLCALVALGIAMLFAVLVHLYLERPMTAWTRARLRVGKLEQAGARPDAPEVSRQISAEGEREAGR